MRRFLIALIALIGMGATGLAFAADGPDGDGIIGSPHDFTDNECYDTTSYARGGDPAAKTYALACLETDTGGWNDSGQLCAVCHAPHKPSTANAIDQLLWNHDDSAATGWTMYDSASMEDAAPTGPSGLSLACLGCHDGVQGIDVFGDHVTANEVIGQAGSDYNSQAEELLWGIVDGANAIDGSTDHPLSIAYRQNGDVVGPTTYGGTDMWNRTETRMDSGRTIESRLEQSGTDFLVQCHSCHDVHNNSTVNQWLLRLPVLDDTTTTLINEASTLCLACHDK